MTRLSADSVFRVSRCVGVVVGLTVFVASNVGEARHAPHPLVSDKFVDLTTTRCRGACPVYAVSISQTGRVSYSGETCVAVSGRHTTRLTKAEMKQIRKAVSVLHVFTSPEICLGCTNIDASIYEVDVWSRGKFARLRASAFRSAPIAPLVEAILQGEVKNWVGKPRLKEGSHLSCVGDDSMSGLW